MNEATYTTQQFPDHTITTVSLNLPVYGRWANLTLTSYTLAGPTWILYRFEPINPKDRLRGDVFGAQRDGRLLVTDGAKDIEQEIVLPSFMGSIVAPSDIRNGEVPEARAICAALFRKFESLLESCRLHIRERISPAVLDATLSKISRCFDNRTNNAMRRALSEINWRFMLRGSGLTDQAMGVIDYSLANNPIRFNGINATDHVIEPISLFEVMQIQSVSARLENMRQAMATELAMTLLAQVCGDDLSKQFQKFGFITFKAHGYSFQVEPGHWIKAKDPNGVTAQLCIHTVGYSCHPIDEVVIAYLNLNHNINAFLKTANVFHDPTGRFQRHVNMKAVAA